MFSEVKDIVCKCQKTRLYVIDIMIYLYSTSLKSWRNKSYCDKILASMRMLRILLSALNSKIELTQLGIYCGAPQV